MPTVKIQKYNKITKQTAEAKLDLNLNKFLKLKQKK